MPSINLAPGTQQIAAAQKRRRRLYVMTILILLITSAAWGGVFLYQQQLEREAEDIQQQLRNVQTETARLADQADRVRLFEGRLTALGSLLSTHTSWDPILGGVEQLIPTTVTLEDLMANSQRGQVQLAGKTSDIDQVAVSLASFLDNQSVFTDGVLGGVTRKEISSPEEGVPPTIQYDFQIELTFNPSILTAAQ